MATTPAANPMGGTTSAAYTRGANAHFAAGVTQPDDGNYEQLQRLSGGYQPGQFETMTDQIEQGSDDDEP
jgi:hypothetical protein